MGNRLFNAAKPGWGKPWIGAVVGRRSRLGVHEHCLVRSGNVGGDSGRLCAWFVLVWSREALVARVGRVVILYEPTLFVSCSCRDLLQILEAGDYYQLGGRLEMVSREVL
jgi:hypothetical protein